MRVSVYEVGPRDGLQNIKQIIDTETKVRLIYSLYDAGFENVEEVSFAHPKLVPQMADAEQVFQRGGVLVMNQRGFDRAKAAGAKKFNIVFSPCEDFNMRNMKKTRSEIVQMYQTMLNGVPKENVRVYLSMAFGSPYTGKVSNSVLKNCICDAKLFGSTVVFADTVGIGEMWQVKDMANLSIAQKIKPALHLHHKGDEDKAIKIIQSGLFYGITEFDSSIGGLGGCPFTDKSGANISTEKLVKYLHAWGFETGINEDKLKISSAIVDEIKTNMQVLKAV